MAISKTYIEEVGTSTVRVSKRTKRNMQAGVSAMRIANKKNDPLYKRYMYFRKKTLELKKKLMKKYRRRGPAQARRSMR